MLLLFPILSFFSLSSGCSLISCHGIQAATVSHSYPCFLPKADSSICIVLSSLQQIPEIDVHSLAGSLTFDNCFNHSRRQTAYFGDLPYNYSFTNHTPSPLSSNSLVQNCISTLNETFPGTGLNSALVNYYPDARAIIPFHADDETDICYDSYIFTLSIGSTREMTFRDKNTKQHLLKLALSNRSLICFSKSSQSYYEHAVLAGDPQAHIGPRISLTFRKLVRKNPML